MNKLDERKLDALEREMEEINALRYAVDKLGEVGLNNMFMRAVKESGRKNCTVSKVLRSQSDALFKAHEAISARNVKRGVET